MFHVNGSKVWLYFQCKISFTPGPAESIGVAGLTLWSNFSTPARLTCDRAFFFFSGIALKSTDTLGQAASCQSLTPSPLYHKKPLSLGYMLCTYVSCCFASFSSKDGYRPIFPCLRDASNVIPGSSSWLLGIGPTWGSSVGDLFPSWNEDQEWLLNTQSTPSKTDIFGTGTSKCPSKGGVHLTKSQIKGTTKGRD